MKKNQKSKCTSVGGLFRVISGIEFEGSVCCHLKEDAKGIAERYRKNGFLARVVVNKGDYPYCVYVHMKK